MSTSKGNGHTISQADSKSPASQKSSRSSRKKHPTNLTDSEDEMDTLMAMVESYEDVTGNESQTEHQLNDTDLDYQIPRQPVVSPFIPINNLVYGTYKGTLGAFELDLRVDIDGPKSQKKISGDYYQVSGQTKSYYGSFIVESIVVTVASGTITITGTATTTWSTTFRKLRIGIKQTSIFAALAPAFLQWFDVSTNAAGALYVCNHIGRAYRTVKLEQDCTSGIAPFVSYNTGSLTSGGSARVLSVNSAFREAGIDLVNSGIANVVPMVNLTPPANKWSNAELHQSMVNNFSLYQNTPQWAVWLLHAYEHELGSGLLGIMFDQLGLQRQGCAVFYRGIGGTTAEQRRLQLYTTVHELGHCFNLLHSWQKSLATPPRPNIPSSLSYMNYPWYFPGGPSTFWNSFPFQFDPVEITHMRHGLRRNVIMGGNPFLVGSSLHDHGNIFEEPIEDRSSLILEIEAKSSYMLGEPVYLETKLSRREHQSTRVVSNLHADYGFIAIGIVKPNGHVEVYEPLAERCAMPETAILNDGNPTIYESSYIGFGKHGFYFDQVGNYQLKAVYVHEDGSRITSNTLSLRVKNPLNKEDDEIADLMLQEDVGMLINFQGSDADYLKKGNDALQEVADAHHEHPMAIYAEFVKGVNAQRTFKTITTEKAMDIREPNLKESEALLTDAIERSKGKEGLDNITLNEAMQKLTTTYLQDGNQKAAESTAKDMVQYFGGLKIKQHVKEKIKKQSAELLSKKQ